MNIFYRHANEKTLLKPSIETFDNAIGSGWFESENIMKYWKERWYPDLPNGISNLDEFETWVEHKVRKAEKSKSKKSKLDILDIIASIEPYTSRDDEELGPLLEAEGVNALQSCGGGTGVPNFDDEWVITGDEGSENLQRDGIIVRNPIKIGKVKDIEKAIGLNCQDFPDKLEDLMKLLEKRK